MMWGRCDRLFSTAILITQHRTAFAQEVAEQRRSIPSVDEVCQVLQQFYADPYGQHLKQEWLQKQLKIPEATRDDAENLAELFNTATEDFLCMLSNTGSPPNHSRNIR